jgi:hypothetical protein
MSLLEQLLTMGPVIFGAFTFRLLMGTYYFPM